MSQQLIKQPDGKFALFSSISETWIFTNATRQEVSNFLGAEARREAVIKAKELIAKIDAGEKPYGQFTMTYKQACRKAGK